MSELLHPADFHLEYREVNGLRMHMALEGPEGGPLIVLLHGFPEFWYSWRHQIKALTAAGFRVVAPDQRGYNLTDKRAPYDIFTLTDDIAALIKTVGYEKATAVIGHDWGGLVTWTFGARFPRLVEKLVVCNVPHPKISQDVIKNVFLPQMFKSWYMFFFQVPRLPERMVSANGFRTFRAQLRKETKGQVREEELAHFVTAWSQPGAMEGGINWYRALFRENERIQKADLRVHVPSLLIWGDADAYLTKETAEWSRQYIDDLTIRYLSGISHWVQQEAPEEVNRLLLSFLKPDLMRANGD